jgi:hypothetical protein
MVDKMTTAPSSPSSLTRRPRPSPKPMSRPQTRTHQIKEHRPTYCRPTTFYPTIPTATGQRLTPSTKHSNARSSKLGVPSRSRHHRTESQNPNYQIRSDPFIEKKEMVLGTTARSSQM